jgi:hypothetical protein
MYESYMLEFHRVSRAAGGALAFEPYDRAPFDTPALHPDPAEPSRRPTPILSVRPAPAG